MAASICKAPIYTKFILVVDNPNKYIIMTILLEYNQNNANN